MSTLAGALLGSLLLFAAEFTPLYQVHVSGVSGVVTSMGTGAHQSYALIPVAILAALLSLSLRAGWRAPGAAAASLRGGGRPALLALGLLGLLALLIAVLGDLPDARATGLVFRGGHYVQASATPSVGLYLETLGAVILLGTALGTLLLLGAPRDIHRSVDGGRSAR